MLYRDCISQAQFDNWHRGIMQIWLRPNTRILWLQLAVTMILLVTGGGLTLAGWTAGKRLLLVGGGLLIAGGVGALGYLLKQLLRARLAYRGGQLLFGVRRGGYIEVPLEVVECFFLGHGPAPVSRADGPPPQNANLVIRLAEAAPEWQERTVDPQLARWCGGYVTLNGLWCEPLSVDRVRQLNHRLAATKRARKQSPTSPKE
jgi:hypothetical protein